MKAVIVAAGRGSRLMNHRPKTLLPLGDSTILEHILRNLNQAGVDEFVIVVGYQARIFHDFLLTHDYFDLNIQTVYNADWMKGNGISVLSAKEVVGDEPFILSMSDHLVSPDAVAGVVHAKNSANLLLVDPDLERIFDLDDATKVRVAGQKIVSIGKELEEYNAIDCGIFRLKPDFFEAMSIQLKHGEDSISAAIRELIRIGDMEAVFMSPNHWWIDIDTPEAFQFAKDNLDRIEPANIIKKVHPEKVG
ncbi:MAG: NTP transferase domain-containing protein [Calditrichaeota bacterium]|nr:NTP transferase domain-containing protein [Calditrichota bacterium]